MGGFVFGFGVLLFLGGCFCCVGICGLVFCFLLYDIFLFFVVELGFRVFGLFFIFWGFCWSRLGIVVFAEQF
ncbi:MAG: hypothetical protein QW261_02000, partial [Candidatus Jordarchaeaceae archaeon]